MDYHTLQNATMSSIESDGTSSCSDCSLDEKPPINDQQDVVSVNEFSEGLNCSFRNQIAPGNPCQVPKPYSDDYEGVYDFVNEPPVPNNNSVLNVTIVNTFIVNPIQMAPLISYATQSVKTAKPPPRCILPAMPKKLQDTPSVPHKTAARKHKAKKVEEQHSVRSVMSLRWRLPPAKMKILQDVPTVSPSTVALKANKIPRKPNIDVSKEIDAIKTRVCPNCGIMFDSVGEKWSHYLNCTHPFKASNVSIKKSKRKSNLGVIDNFVNCGILDTPVTSEAEPQVLLEVASLAHNTNNPIKSELLKSTPLQQDAIGQFVLIDGDLNLLKSEPIEASILVGTSSTFSRAKRDQPASKVPLKEKANPRKRNKSKPTEASGSVKKPKTLSRAKKSDVKVLKIISNAKPVPKKRMNKPTIADLMKLPDLLNVKQKVKKVKSDLLEEVSWGKKKVFLRHSCELCDFAFVTPSKLARHMMSHKHDMYKRFNCDECRKGFIRKDYLVTHFANIHLSLMKSKKKFEGSLKCCHCPTVFKSKSRMTHHIKSNHSTYFDNH